MAPLLSAEEKKELMTATFEDPPLFCRAFLPNWFEHPMSWAHRGIFALLLRKTDFLANFGTEVWPSGEIYHYGMEDLQRIIKHFVWDPDPDNKDSAKIPLFSIRETDGKLAVDLLVSQFTQAICPRGFGKTTIVNACNIYKILFKERRFLVYLSESSTHAEEQLGNVKRELEENDMLREVFGNVVPERSDRRKWRDDSIETTTGVKAIAIGRGGQIRGKNKGGDRPDDITVDDVEDEESVLTDAQRLKVAKWFMAAVRGALPRVGKTGVITALGTLLHHDALLAQNMKDPEWITIHFGALDNEGEPVWVHYMSKEKFEKERRAFARKGMLADFYREYMSKLTNEETAKFPHEFTYQIMHRTDFVGVAEAIDPAISDDPSADFCTIAVSGMTEKGQHHVLDMWGKKGAQPREQIDEYFRLHFLWDVTHHGVEAIAYQKALIHLLREEMFRKAKTFGTKAYFEIMPITHGKTGKVPRVEGILSPRYMAGYITHQHRFPDLEQQLIDWPNGKMDFPDALAMAIGLLDPLAGFAFDPGDSDNGEDPLSRDQFEPLEEWRYAP